MAFPAALAGLVLVCCSCQAPRDNPLDPAAGGNLEGRVLTRRATPISGAQVSISGAGRSVLSDTLGQFGIYGLPEESSWVEVRAQDYVPDSARRTFVKGVIDTLTATLDGLPWLSDYSVTTHIYDRSWPPYPPDNPPGACSLATAAGDVDGMADLDRVWAEIPGIRETLALDYDPARHSFVAGLSSDSLPDASLEALPGRPISLLVADHEGMTVRSEPLAVTRIFRYFPTPVFPAGGEDSLQGETTFVWNRFSHGFWVHYRCEIDKIVEGGAPQPALAFTTPGLLDTAYRLNTDSLNGSGVFVWTVEAIDSFGNSSRSAEQSFYAR